VGVADKGISELIAIPFHTIPNLGNARIKLDLQCRKQ
jgi:hypothetical protein